MVHLGHNIAKLRGIRRLPQKDVAKKLSMTQQEYSKVEKSATLEDNKLNLIAEALGVTAEAIKNFNDEAVTNIFNTNTLNDNSTANMGHEQVNNFNPMDKYVELVEEHRKLYERMLKDKDILIEVLQKQLKGK